MKKDNFRWLLMITVALIALATSANMLAFAPLLGDISKDLGISIPVAQASFLGIFVFVVAISTLLSGGLADKFGTMPVLILAISTAVVSNFLFLVIGNNVAAITVLRVLQGYGAGAVFALIPSVSAAWFTEKEKGFTVGLGMTGVNGGMMLGVALSPIINQTTGNWRVTMTRFGFIDIVVLLIAIYVVTQFKKHTPINHLVKSKNDESKNVNMKSVLSNPTTWFGIIMCMLISWLLNALNDLTPQYFALENPIGVGFGAVVAGKLMLIVQIGTVVGSLVVGIVIDKIFKGNTKPVLLIGFVITAICVYSILSPAVYNTSGLLNIVLFIAGTFVAFLNPSAATLATQIYPEHVIGRAVGLWLGIGAFGGSLGVFVGAFALHSTGTYNLTITLFVVAAFVGLVLSRMIKTKNVSEINNASNLNSI